MDLQLFSQEKREAPTQRKREEARRKGQVFRSAELSAAGGLLAVWAALRASATRLAGQAAGLAVDYWGGLEPVESIAQAGAMYRDCARALAAMVWPVAGVAFAVALVSGAGQTGLVFNPGLVAPRLERLNPLSGLQRLFSRRTLVEGLKCVLKVTLVAAVVYSALRRQLHQWAGLGTLPPLEAAGVVARAVHGVVLPAGLVLLLLGLADFAYQWWEHEQGLRMTRQELKEELKDTEGRPEVKSMQRTRQRQLARRRMMAEVKTADVVVTNPVHYAVALRYDVARAPAPEVVAKGRELLAARIVAEARAHGVMVVPNPPLARALYRAVEIGALIPTELYQAVAEVLAFVYRARAEAEEV